MDEGPAYRLQQFAKDANKETLSPVDWISFHSFTAYMHMFKHDIAYAELRERLEQFGFTREKALEHADVYFKDRDLLAIYDSGRAWKFIGRQALDEGRRGESDSVDAEAAGGMSAEAQELHRIITASVRDMLDVYRLQAQAGPVTDKALEQIVFRAAHAIVHSLSPYPAAQRAALLPNIVRLLLAAFLEDVAGGGEKGMARRSR